MITKAEATTQVMGLYGDFNIRIVVLGLYFLNLAQQDSEKKKTFVHTMISAEGGTS